MKENVWGEDEFGRGEEAARNSLPTVTPGAEDIDRAEQLGTQWVAEEDRLLHDDDEAEDLPR